MAYHQNVEKKRAILYPLCDAKSEHYSNLFRGRLVAPKLSLRQKLMWALDPHRSA